MSSAGAFLQEMLVLYGIAFLGFIVRKKNILNENTNDVLTQLILYITLPALIIFSLDITFSAYIIKDFLLLMSMSIYILVLSCFLAIWMKKRAVLEQKQKNVYEGLIIFGNQGFIGYAVSFIILGEQGIIYLTIFNFCYLILIWTYGLFLFSKSKLTINWKQTFCNSGIFSTFIGIILFLLPFHLPVMVSNLLESVGNMTIPLSMLLIGSLIAKVNYNELFLLIKNTYLWKMAFVRLLFIPFLLLPFTFLNVPFSLLIIAILVSGMPAAPTIILFSQKYKADTLFASLGVLITTLLCIFTIPFLYLLLSIIYNHL
ncbi:AEC family transporter [Cytobacillus praedii]|uniref:AEC family transporter n=1 Tax=Cytobacillus praedii TaxID=1742358 RepID=UPI002E1FF4F7|nr:AEC family transporter [Cytobacillus praedii]MED3572229.1 AEC family transporter [Cytobacillus praedii]